MQRQVKKTVAVGNSQGGDPAQCRCHTRAGHRETAQNTAQGEEKTATPLETGARKRADAEKQRAAEAKVVPGEALTKQDRERQQRLEAERELDVADRRDLAECLKFGMGLLTRDQGQ